MAIKQLVAGKWHKVIAPAANTVYVQFPNQSGCVLQYGATKPADNDTTGLYNHPGKVITINAALTAFIRPDAHCVVFATDTAGADPMTDTNAPLHLTKDLPMTTTAAVGSNVSLAITAAGGAAPYTYRWYYRRNELANEVWIDPTDPGVPGGNPNPSAATDTLINHAVSVGSSGLYRCAVEDNMGRGVSSVTTALVVS